jgi:hypothetical protein
MKDEVMAGPQGATEKLRQILAKCPPDLMAADAAIEILGDDLTESYGKSHSVLVPLKDVIAFSKELQRDNESKVLVYTDESLERVSNSADLDSRWIREADFKALTGVVNQRSQFVKHALV